MLKRLNNILNVVMGVAIVGMIGYAIYVYWEYQQYSEAYVVQSAPWYTSIVVYGVVTAIVLLLTMSLKYRIREKLNKQ